MEGHQEFLVKAIYPFPATKPGELYANEGDIIRVLSHLDEHWYNGELNGKIGLFPVTYAETIQAGPLARLCVAIETYMARRPGEIGFIKGDQIKVMEEIGSGWLRGECNGNVGIFPSIFVDMGSPTDDEDISEGIYSNSSFYENLDITVAEALYGFDARTTEELSFPMGAEIVITRDVDSDWYEGTFEGNTGLFPKNYVQIMGTPLDHPLPEDSSKRPCARSIYPFVGESDSELTFKEGQRIYLRNRAGSQWLEGELNNKVGRFPASFVNIEVDLPSEQDLKDDIGYHILSRADAAPQKVHWTEGLTARALYHFSALHPGDLGLNEGDTIMVLKVLDDNWLEGKLEGGAAGTCPIAYLEPVERPNSSDIIPPKRSMFMELKAGLEARETNKTNTQLNQGDLRNGDLNNSGVHHEAFMSAKGERTLLDLSFSEDAAPILRPVSGPSDKSSLQPSLKPNPAPRPPSVTRSPQSSSQSSVFDCTSLTSSDLLSPITPSAVTSNNKTLLCTPSKPSKSNFTPVAFSPTKSPGSITHGNVAPQRFFPPPNNAPLSQKQSLQQSERRQSGSSESSLFDTSVSNRASVINLAVPLLPLPPGVGSMPLPPHVGSRSSSPARTEEVVPLVPRRKAPPPPKKKCSMQGSSRDERSNSFPRPSITLQDKAQESKASTCMDSDKVDNRAPSTLSVEYPKHPSSPKPDLSPKKKPPPPPPARHNKSYFGVVGRPATVSGSSKEVWKKPSCPEDSKKSEGAEERQPRRRQRPYSVYYVGEDEKGKDIKLTKSNSLEDIRSSQRDMSSKLYSSQFDLNKDEEAVQPSEAVMNEGYSNTDDVPGIAELDKTIAEAEKNLQVEKRALTGMKTISQMLIHDEAKHQEMQSKMYRSQQKVDEWQAIISSLKDERSFMIESYHKRKKLNDQMTLLQNDLEKQVRSQRSLEVLLGVVEESRREEVMENLTMCEGIINDLNIQMKNMEDSMQSLNQRPTQSSQQHMAEQRKKVVTELMNTEQDYIRDLQMCVTYFYEELKDSKVVEADILFGNMQAIVGTSQRLLEAFEGAVTDKEVKQQELGKCFVDNADEMKYVYSVYCRNHDDAIALLEKYEDVPEAQEAFRKCLNAIRDTTKCWDLSSFLIKPVQRVLKYPLLLSELLKCTPQIHKDKDNLIRALSAMTEVAAAINEVKRRKDLVVKYKRVEETGISNKFQKLSWHSVMKKSSRFTQRLTQSTGLVSQTVDKSFIEEEKKFSNLEKAVKNLSKNISGFVEQFQDTVTRQQVTGENIQEYYSEASTCTEVTMYHSMQQRISGILLDAFVLEVQNRVLTPLNTLLAMFQGPQRLIQKRHHKCLDYDSGSNKIEKIKDKDKLKQARDALATAKRNYEALNAQLLEELPLFRQKTMSLVKDCILNFAQAKRTFHAVILGEYTNLMLLPLIKDGDNDIIHHQSARIGKAVDSLASLSFIPDSFSGKESLRKKKGPKKHRPPAVPPAPDSSLSRKRMAPAPPVPEAPPGTTNKPGRPVPVPRKRVPSTQTQQTTKEVETTLTDLTPYIVVCTFEALNVGEVSVNEGDFVSVQRQCDTSGNPEWWLVSSSGVTGYVPSDFIEPYEVDQNDDDEDEGIDNGSDDVSDDADDIKQHPVPPLTTPSIDTIYYALFDFEGTSKAELSVDEGQLVTVLQKHDLEGNCEWWLVEAEGEKGYVAANFLAPIEQQGS